MITKHPLFLNCHFGSMLKPNLFRVQKLNCLSISTKSCTWLHLAMAIAVALFIGARRTNIHWKSEKYGYTFGI
jgi:hypothetical protein